MVVSIHHISYEYVQDRKERLIMKAKTFTYNQIISFFIQNNLPLNEKQVKLIASKVKLEMEQLEIYREKQKAKKDADFIRREKRKSERKSPVALSD
jgi:hypothetical protein